MKLRFITLHNSICGICASWFSDIGSFPQQPQCLGILPFSSSLYVLNGRTCRGCDTLQFKLCCLPKYKNEIQNLKKGRLIGSMNMNYFRKKNTYRWLILFLLCMASKQSYLGNSVQAFHDSFSSKQTDNGTLLNQQAELCFAKLSSWMRYYVLVFCQCESNVQILEKIQ